ncbi:MULTISPECIES: LacI family DNA-binding transcriptional regulator [unclassified Streptomyces]|uniref:LacI family DNA-binding transcriptional regulator n=1 Tax=unclassified Streptomyces TaxID=2593676 RepID=UPI003648E1F2
MTRLKDVAARAGVSVRTVSNVVNGTAAVAEDTRRHVQGVLDEMGYRPNLAARNLRGGRTGLIGLAIPELASPYFGPLAGLLVEAAQRRSWTVIIDQTHGDARAELRLLDPARGRVVDGLIISPWTLSATELSTAARSIPAVLLGERHPQGLVDRVAVDNVGAADQATTHLLRSGRRRVAALGLQSHLHNGTAEQRRAGYRRALAREGLPADPLLEAEVRALHRADGARAMADLLDRGAAPDAVFAFSDELALGAMHTARLRGMRVPEQIAFVGFDDIEDGLYANPALSTVAPDKEQIAERALQCLADRIYSPGNTVPALDVIVPHQLLLRASSD